MILHNRLLVLCSFALITTSVFSQKNKLSIGTQIPLNYSAAYEENIYGAFYVNYHFGYLTHPYVKVLFSEAEKRGLEPAFSELLEGYFQRGISHQGQLKYAPEFMKGFYVGAAFKTKNIRAVEVPYQVAADNFGIDLTPYENNELFQSLIDDLDFSVTMTIPGVYLGRAFQLGKSNWSVYLEASYHRIISSTSLATFTGSGEEVPLLNAPLNEEINEALEEDGNLYSVNLGISYTLPVSLHSAIASLFKKSTKD